MRRLVGLLVVTALVPGLAACSEKKEASKADVAAWLKAAQAASAKGTSTTVAGGVTTTIPATTSTVFSPLQRLAMTRAFLDAAEARRLAQERCQQLAGQDQRIRC